MKSATKLADKMIEYANNDTHGYDQQHRYGPDFDCSSLFARCGIYAGFSFQLASTTRNLYQQLLTNGFIVVNDSNRYKGDVFLKVGKHICVATDSQNIVHARYNEKGKASGGKTGDQTGKEICISPYYEITGGWIHMRYIEPDTLLELTCMASKLYIRESPTTKSSKIGCFTRGQKMTVNVEKSTNEWYRVHNYVTNVDGYSSRKYIK